MLCLLETERSDTKTNFVEESTTQPASREKKRAQKYFSGAMCFMCVYTYTLDSFFLRKMRIHLARFSI